MFFSFTLAPDKSLLKGANQRQGGKNPNLVYVIILYFERIIKCKVSFTNGIIASVLHVEPVKTNVNKDLRLAGFFQLGLRKINSHDRFSANDHIVAMKKTKFVHSGVAFPLASMSWVAVYNPMNLVCFFNNLASCVQKNAKLLGDGLIAFTCNRCNYNLLFLLHV